MGKVLDASSCGCHGQWGAGWLLDNRSSQPHHLCLEEMNWEMMNDLILSAIPFARFFPLTFPQFLYVSTRGVAFKGWALVSWNICQKVELFEAIYFNFESITVSLLYVQIKSPVIGRIVSFCCVQSLIDSLQKHWHSSLALHYPRERETDRQREGEILTNSVGSKQKWYSTEINYHLLMNLLLRLPKRPHSCVVILRIREFVLQADTEFI